MSEETMGENQLINVEPSFSHAPQLTLNPDFKAILTEMRSITDDYHKLVDDVDLDSLSEEQIDGLTKQLEPMQKYYKRIESAKKNMRKLYNDQRDKMTAELDDILAANGMNELNEMDATKKQLRRDLLNHRANRRWAELKTTFEDNFELYPDIKKYAPNLMDWGDFRVSHPKMVSGAKTANITDKQRSEINNTIAQWNDDLQAMIRNDAKLPEQYRGPLLNQWVTQPTHTNLIRLNEYYKQLAEKQEAELKAAQENADTKKVDAAKMAMAKAEDVNKAPKPVPGEFDWLLDFAFENKNTHNITQDDAKASLIIMLSMGMMDQNSIFYKNIGRDYEKMLRAIRYILSR